MAQMAWPRELANPALPLPIALPPGAAQAQRCDPHAICTDLYKIQP